MIDPTAKLSVSRRAIGPGICRGGVYDKPRPVSDADVKLMQRIDKLHVEFPFAGSRMLQGRLVQHVNRHAILPPIGIQKCPPLGRTGSWPDAV